LIGVSGGGGGGGEEGMTMDLLYGSGCGRIEEN